MPHFLYYQQKDIFMVEHDLLFHISDNLTDEKRVGHITVTDGDVTKVITVTQLPNKIVFVPSSSVTIDDTEQNITFNIEYGGTASTLEVASAASWQQVTQITTSSMTVHVPDFITGTTNRSANVAITDGTISGWASITQLSQWIRFNDTSSSAMSMSAESSGDSYSVQFKAKDIDEMFTLTDAPSWIQNIRIIQGNGTPKPYRLQFDLLTNTLSVPRTGTVTITDGNRHYAVLTIEQQQYVPEPEKGLTFVAKQANTSVALRTIGSPYDVMTLEYNINSGAWQSYTIGNAINLPNVNDTVMFRNTSNTNTRFSSNYNNFYNFSITGKALVKDNLFYLMKKDGYVEDIVTIGEEGFYGLFSGCTGLTDAREMTLPRNVLASSCYERMFYGCTSLVSAPSVLPAMELNYYCYKDMFKGCSSLINPPVLPATSIERYSYSGMFCDCTSLTDTPALPATSISGDSYALMFAGCTSLTGVSSLPAMTMHDHCYEGMFRNCTSLVTAPALPATGLHSSCYNGMFKGCTSLTDAPVLPATTLETYCYQSMFEGCWSLTVAPELPAATLATRCYSSMFNGCISLTSSPVLPATTLEPYCYDSMFSGCISLTSITCLATSITATDCTSDWVSSVPTAGTFIKDSEMTSWTIDSTSGIPYHWTVEDYEEGIFLSPAMSSVTYDATGVTSIITKSVHIGTLTASTTAEWITSTTINGNQLSIHFTTNSLSVERVGIVTVSDGVYSATYTLTQNPKGDGLTFVATQANSKVALNKVSSPPGGRLEYSTNNGVTWTEYTIGSRISLPNVGDTVLFRNMSTSSTFSQYSNIYYYFNITGKCNVENDITYLINKNGGVDTISGNSCFVNLFSGCTGLCDASRLLLPSTSLTSNCYSNMFKGCTSLTAAPELPATTLATWCYAFMFADCTSLTDAPALPATALSNYCYQSMFSDCTSLTSAPELPATVLAVNCYWGLFAGCSSLTVAPALPATTLAPDCYTYLFNGCSSLTSITCLATGVIGNDNTCNWVAGVSSTGTFTKKSGANWSRGVHGIPNNWTVIDAP